MQRRFTAKRTVLFLMPGKIDRQTGGSSYDRRLAERLSERGFQVDVVSVPDLPYFAGLLAGSVISPLLLLRLARRKYDIVIQDGWAHPTTLLFNIACSLSRWVRLIVLVHQVRWTTTKAPARYIVRIAERQGLRSAQLIVAVSRFISTEVERLLGSSRRTLVATPGSAPFPGIDRTAHKQQQLPIRLLFVGNCTRLKGLDHLIAALGEVREPALELDIVGDMTVDARYVSELLRQVEALGISDRVTFHGAVGPESLGRFYAQADIFTFPSLYEGFGMVLTEAMHAGLPIVATRTGPAGEIVQEGENALLVPPADPAALAHAIRTLASNPEMRREFAHRSRALADLLPTWKQTCDIICDQIEIMSRTTPDTKRSMRATPTRLP